MPGIAINDVVEYRLSGLLFGQYVENVLHYICTTAGTGSVSVSQDLTDLMAADDGNGVTSVCNTWRLVLPLPLTINALQMQVVQPLRTIAKSLVMANVVVGRTAATTANLSAVVQKGTDLAGRSQIGSVHIPGLATLDQDDGELTVAYITALANFKNNLILPIVAPGTNLTIKPVIYSPPIKAQPDHVPPIPARAYRTSLITRAQVLDGVRVMRRRTVRVGI